MSSIEGLPTLVLASASPRRSRLLSELGLRFITRPPTVDESPLPGETPEEHVERLARVKAQAEGGEGELVLAADTIVTDDGLILGKPSDREEARGMLRRLAGRWHRVITGVALFEPDGPRTESLRSVSQVRFAPLGEDEIEWYVATDEPLDKAGAYAIQGLAGLFVEEIRGSYSNIVGLPMSAVYRLFKQLGYDLRLFRGAAPANPRT